MKTSGSLITSSLILILLVSDGIGYPNLIPNSAEKDRLNSISSVHDIKRIKRSSETLEEYLDDCGNTFLMADRKSFKFASPEYDSETGYPAGVTCSWSFIGDKNCIAELTCKEFDLNDSEDCEDDRLEVVDGVGGVEAFCGKRSLAQPIRASHNLRDLYVTLKISKEGVGRKGFFCEVRCSANLVCGLINVDDRIVGGEDAKLNEFPWQGAIVYPGTRSPKCGASLINNNWALTAAHCFMFENTKPSEIEILFHANTLDQTRQKEWKDVKLGSSGSIRSSGYKDPKLSDTDEKTQRFKILEIVNHPKFNSKYDYDVALVKLERKLDLAHPDTPTPICLPNIENTNESFVDEIPMVVGWGLADEKAGATTRRLQKLAVKVMPADKCAKWNTHQFTARMLCAGYEEGGKDACTGDSGGPLSLQRSNDQWEQIGIVSWGEGCARKEKPGVYTRITEVNQWIRRHATGSTWCKSTTA